MLVAAKTVSVDSGPVAGTGYRLGGSRRLNLASGEAGMNSTMSERKRRKYDVDAATFIRIWQSSESAAEAARRCNMPKAICLARASGYRKAGVHLKSMNRRTRGLDIESLNKMIDEMEKEHGTGEMDVDKVLDILKKRGGNK